MKGGNNMKKSSIGEKLINLALLVGGSAVVLWLVATALCLQYGWK